jgi:RNA 2',3'-cyclic 3'-phosphodiesterase
MRLFIALEIPANVRAALGEISAKLRSQAGRGVRWTDPRGIHLTLKFIGHVEEARVEAIRGALAGVHAAQAVEAAFRGLGWFPNARHPRVIWAGVEAGASIPALATEIERALEPLGIARESREFRPHLTLARIQEERIKEEKGLDGLRQEVERLGAPEFGRATYTDFDLMQSKLRPQGAEYTRVERFPFAPSLQAAPTGGR